MAVTTRTAAATVDDAIVSRHSCRRFTSQDVSRETVHQLLDVARHAPSGSNTQPWRVFVVSGGVKEAISSAIVNELNTGMERTDREYQYYPVEWFEPYLARRRACGWGLYSSLGITRDQKTKMHEQRSRNYTFFDAPVGMVFCLDRRLETGSFMDLGMFLQNIMIAARGKGLDTCAQAAFANYHEVLREHLPIPDTDIVVAGMAIGYSDAQAPENMWRPDRDSVETFATWHGFSS